MNRRSFLITASAISFLATTKAWAVTTPSTLKAKGSMRIATTGSNAPYTFVGPDNKLRGFDIDWSIAICEKLGVKPDFAKLDWRGILPGVTAGQFDAAMSAIRITPERAANFRFSKPYGTDDVVLVVPQANTTIKSVADLKGLTIGAATGSLQEQVAKEQVSGATLRSYPGLADILMDMSVGRLDGGFLGKGGAVHAIQTAGSKMKIVGDGLASAPLGMVVALENTELAAAISDAIAALQADGSADKIYKKWFAV